MLFLADLIHKEKKLDQAEDSFENFWIGALDAEDQLKIIKYKNKLLQDRPPGLPNKIIARNNNESLEDKDVHSRSKYAKMEMSSIPDRPKDNVTATTSADDSLNDFVVVNSSDIAPENMSNTTTTTFSPISHTNTQEITPVDTSGENNPITNVYNHISHLFNQINPFN